MNMKELQLLKDFVEFLEDNGYLQINNDEYFWGELVEEFLENE